MYEIDFFVKDSGECDVADWITELEEKMEQNKEIATQYKQLQHCLNVLELQGTYGPKNIVKHLDDDIWELRPGGNRVLLFHYKDKKIVLLHHFQKKTQKTPRQEIQQAKRERDEYRRQKRGNDS